MFKKENKINKEVILLKEALEIAYLENDKLIEDNKKLIKVSKYNMIKNVQALDKNKVYIFSFDLEKCSYEEAHSILEMLGGLGIKGIGISKGSMEILEPKKVIGKI